ncbi:Endo-beta-1 4-glucanase D [Ceratocystis platani]|uniref:lytic cellulose monooxygenase (C4-dehydrogenating) n=1 Tax=Ceratocystis fimbriata f. sp. platani TaxID=88771 RepID=A0A0F8B889_CERFI|nr:Endo-beta-1 4-glucanase D [Ceratocystis platani]
MYFTKSSILSAISMASAVSAHTTLFSAWVNGVDQGDGRNVYIRSPTNNNPVKDLTSPDLVCNVNGGKAVAEFVSAAAGDKITFEWYHDNRGDDILAASHKGPLITYIAEYTETNGASGIWSKIAEDGYDGSQWATDALIAAKGKYDFTIPATLKPGKYIIRQEIIGLHEGEVAYSSNPARGAQFYPTCVQFDITGTGSAVPDTNFDFNTGYTYSDAGIVFNFYGTVTSYPIPGPALWSGAGGSSTTPSTPTSSTPEEGTTPAPTGSASSTPTYGNPAQTPSSASTPSVQNPSVQTPSVQTPSVQTPSVNPPASNTSASSPAGTSKAPCYRRRSRAARRAALARENSV